MLALVTLTATFVGPAAMPRHPHLIRMSSTALPDMYRERWHHDQSHKVATPKQDALESEFSAATYVGGLLGASAVAAIGFGASAYSTDFSLSLLGATGMAYEKVLFTDILMRWLDISNVAGCAILPLAVLYLMQASPTKYLAQANADLAAIEDEACLIEWQTDGVEVPICGAVSFDSTDDGMLCVESYSSGSLKWVCA